MNHTPTPWHTKRHDETYSTVADVDGCVLAECADYDDAEFIALACNSHAALVAAVRAARDYLGPTSDDVDLSDGSWDLWHITVTKLRDALAATEETPEETAAEPHEWTQDKAADALA